jgi:hypothetical protein
MKKEIISLILVVMILLLVYNSFVGMGQDQSSDLNSNPTFYYSDDDSDVFLVDHRVEKYTANSWFDIKAITSKPMGDRIWVNMTMYDNIQNDEKIYYKLKVADAEVLLYQGLGEIIYKNGFDSQVHISGDTITANINKQKLNYDIFSISGSAYREDQNESYGEYLIIDEIAKDETNNENTLNLSYIDSKNDVIISYTYSSEIDTKPELDIQDVMLIDHGSKLLLKVNFGDLISNTQDLKYSITLGGALAVYTAGDAQIKYPQLNHESVSYSVDGNVLEMNFERSMLEFLTSKFEVESIYQPKTGTSYSDSFSEELPKYVYISSEELELDLLLFEDSKIVMDLHGTLSETHTQAVRTVVDRMGNENGIAEQTEYDIFLVELKKDFGIENFFEFYPKVDSDQSLNYLDFEFDSVFGNITDLEAISMSVTARFQFNNITQNYHNISLNLLEPGQVNRVGEDFIFNFIYNRININFTDEYKYWEFVIDRAFPGLLKDNFHMTKQELLIENIEYEILKNRIGHEGKFGFFINYNQTAADQDAKKTDDGDEDEGSGFLPGFDLVGLLVSLIVVFFYFSYLKKR